MSNLSYVILANIFLSMFFYVLLNSSNYFFFKQLPNLLRVLENWFCVVTLNFALFADFCLGGYPITSQKLIIFWIYKYVRDIPLFLNKSENLILAHLTNVTGNNILTWWSNPQVKHLQHSNTQLQRTDYWIFMFLIKVIKLTNVQLNSEILLPSRRKNILNFGKKSIILRNFRLFYEKCIWP